MDYDKILNEWFDKIIDKSDKYMEEADKANDDYKQWYNSGISSGLLLATNILSSSLKEKCKQKDLIDTDEEESALVHEGLILLLDRYINIIKINNVTNELSSTEKNDIENKIVKTKDLLKIFNDRTIE